MHPRASRVALVAAVLLTVTGVCRADETALKLAPDADASLVQSRCSVCHSVDYIQMNAAILKRAGWEAEVKKMIKVMAAPIPADEVDRLVDYLVKHYGAE